MKLDPDEKELLNSVARGESADRCSDKHNPLFDDASLQNLLGSLSETVGNKSFTAKHAPTDGTPQSIPSQWAEGQEAGG
jgi:hypothetical protein